MDNRRKYARVEWERRFLLNGFPDRVTVTRVRRIQDLYIEGTRLRLRRASDGSGQVEFKLTQKLRDGPGGARQGLITTTYLSEQEFDVLANLPGRSLTKTRYSVAPFGIDVFEGQLQGLVLAEAEFSSDEEAAALDLPEFVGNEVSNDIRFTGGNIVRASRAEVAAWVAEYGIRLNSWGRESAGARGTLEV